MNDPGNHVMVDTDGVGDNQGTVADAAVTNDVDIVQDVWNNFGTDIAELSKANTAHGCCSVLAHVMLAGQ